MVSVIFNFGSCVLYFTEFTRLQKKIGTPYTAFSTDNDAYHWDIQGAVTFSPGVKCRGGGGWDLNKC